MRHEFEFRFDEAFLRRGLWPDLLQRGLIGSALLLVLLGIVCWFARFHWTYVAIVAVSLAALWLRVLLALRSGAKRLFEFWTHQSPTHTIRWTLSDETLVVDLGESHSRYAWAGMRRLWRYSDVWILEIVKNVSLFVPPDALDEDARKYIEDRCRASGVRS